MSWAGRNCLSLADLFDNLNKRKVVIAIDEAQFLRGPLSTEVRKAIAHAYDYDRNLAFVLTGSEAGLLYDFMKVEDPDSPLYGRSFHEIVLERFDEERSKGFLLDGFKQADLGVNMALVEEAARELGGIPGWLTFFGNSCLSGRCDAREVKRKAVNMALKELGNLLEGRPVRYKHALNAIARGKRSWSAVKEYMEEKEGTTISSSVLHNLIGDLEMMSIIKRTTDSSTPYTRKRQSCCALDRPPAGYWERFWQWVFKASDSGQSRSGLRLRGFQIFPHRLGKLCQEFLRDSNRQRASCSR
ncbi:MAG: ATP-binding protein [Thermoproteota archaeon]